jgi:RNA polymerase sigma factor (sigma-70 family)
MARSDLSTLVRHLRWVLSAEQASGLSDAQLLEHFVKEEDETAFAALMHRHGRMVLGVCRRALGNVQDAEDIYQATFVILARNARRIRKRDAIGSWLYQVAYRLAHKMRRRGERRRLHESQVAAAAHGDPLAEVMWREVRDILDTELASLPDKYRAPLLLCYFEGKTQDEAALQLGWPVRTLQARVARSKELLGARLAKRGLVVGSSSAVLLMATEWGLACVPTAAAQTALQAAVLCASGESIKTTVSASVAAIVEGALRQMATLKILKLVSCAVLALGFLGTGLGFVIEQSSSAETAKPDQEITLITQDAQKPVRDAGEDPLPAGAFLRLGTARLRHAVVWSIAWSPDGNWVASAAGGFDDSVRIWDAATGKEVRRLQGHKTGVAHVSFSPDGRLAGSVDKLGGLHLWDTTSGKTMRVQQMAERAVLAFAPDGKTFVSINKQNRACLVDTGTLEILREFKTGAKLPAPVTTVAWSPNGKTFAFGDTVGKIYLVDALTGLPLRTLAQSGLVECVSFSPDSLLLAAPTQDKAVQVWDVTSGNMVRRLEGHQSAVKAVAWSPDGKSIASGGMDQTARLWDAQTGREILKYGKHQTPVLTVAFSPDGKRVASAGAIEGESRILGGGDKVHIWEVSNGKDVFPEENHVGWLSRVAVLGNGKTLLSCGADDAIRMWDLQSGKAAGQFAVPHSYPRAVAISADGKLLAAGAADGTIRFVELPAGKVVRQVNGDSSPIHTLGFSPDGNRLAASSQNAKTRLWDVASGQMVREIKPKPAEMVSVLTFSPDSKMLCTGSWKGPLRLWNIASGEEIAKFGTHTKLLEQIAYSPDGKYIASVARDTLAIVWDPQTGKEVRRFDQKHQGTAVTFSPDSKLLVTGSGDGAIRFWDLATGKQRTILPGHHGLVTALAFLPDGKSLISGSADSTALCWRGDW